MNNRGKRVTLKNLLKGILAGLQIEKSIFARELVLVCKGVPCEKCPYFKKGYEICLLATGTNVVDQKILVEHPALFHFMEKGEWLG